MSRIVDIEPLLKKYDSMNEGTEFSPIHFINDLMSLEQLPTDAVILNVTSEGCWREEEEYSCGLKSKKIWWDDSVAESEDTK